MGENFFSGCHFFEDFHQNFWLQSTLKNLIYVIYQHFNMSKDASRCGQSIARWIKSIRPVHPKIFLKVASPPPEGGFRGGGSHRRLKIAPPSLYNFFTRRSWIWEFQRKVLVQKCSKIFGYFRVWFSKTRQKCFSLYSRIFIMRNGSNIMFHTFCISLLADFFVYFFKNHKCKIKKKTRYFGRGSLILKSPKWAKRIINKQR